MFKTAFLFNIHDTNTMEEKKIKKEIEYIFKFFCGN